MVFGPLGVVPQKPEEWLHFRPRKLQIASRHEGPERQNNGTLCLLNRSKNILENHQKKNLRIHQTSKYIIRLKNARRMEQTLSNIKGRFFPRWEKNKNIPRFSMFKDSTPIGSCQSLWRGWSSSLPMTQRQGNLSTC